MSLFVDTSIWYAAADRDDADNARARAMLRAGEALVTTDHVLVETWSLIHHRLHRKAAERFWEGLRNGVAKVESVGSADLEAAWDMGVVYRDQVFSIVDRTSFTVMRALELSARPRSKPTSLSFALARIAVEHSQLFNIFRQVCPVSSGPNWRRFCSSIGSSRSSHKYGRR
jgi:uncharacterized protein